jgi:uncharacterized damage-inducible protein DinB
MSETKSPEPWLRGTLLEVQAVPRAVLHALELASDDLHQWCGDLTDEELNRRPDGIAPVAFHLKHIARSVDRLLTYAEGRPLDAAQIAALQCEESADSSRREIFAELDAGLGRAAARIRHLDAERLGDSRWVGSKKLPTTLGGLLVHIADHTQRHVGQAVTTAKIVRARRGAEAGQP